MKAGFSKKVRNEIFVSLNFFIKNVYCITSCVYVVFLFIARLPSYAKQYLSFHDFNICQRVK